MIVNVLTAFIAGGVVCKVTCVTGGGGGSTLVILVCTVIDGGGTVFSCGTVVIATDVTDVVVETGGHGGLDDALVSLTELLVVIVSEVLVPDTEF